MTFHWNPFYRIGKFEDKHNKKNKVEGVYLIGFIDDTSNAKWFIPYYVGEAENIFGRLTNHFACLTGGSYTLYDVEKIFKQGVQTKLSKSDMLYQPLGANTLHQLLQSPVSNTLQWMKQHVVMTWANISDDSSLPFSGYGNRLIAERVISNAIGKDNLIGSHNRKVNHSFRNLGNSTIHQALDINKKHTIPWNLIRTDLL